MDNIKDKIENSGFHKYQGIAPEGFILIPEKLIEDLLDFDNWKDFKGNPKLWIEERSKEILKK